MKTTAAFSNASSVRRLVAAALTSTLAAALLALAAPAAQAQTHISLQINGGGFQTVGHGHHNARHGKVWVEGHWVPRSHGPVWVAGHWAPQAPRYYGPAHYSSGYSPQRAPRWDRDGDGVPNRHDRRPNNPWKY